MADDELGDRRRSQDEVIVAGLAGGMTYREAAQAAGTSERTVRRRMSAPEFAAQVRQVRAELASQMSGRLLEAGPMAVAVLVEMLGAELPADRWRAATALLTQGRTARRESDLLERLADIERLVRKDHSQVEGGQS